jgi:hypothetical protein
MKNNKVEAQTLTPAKKPTGLDVVNKLLEKFHKEDLIYCHWKSNEHVREGILGLTDLDVLVDKRASLLLQKALSESGFKRFCATPNNGYPAVDDYLAMDEETGKLIHLHLHYQLVAGVAHLKGTHLPWENLVLTKRILDQENNIYVVDPNVEMILLLVRAALKLRTRDYMLNRLSKNYFSGDFATEFYWLKKRIDPEKMLEISTELMGEKAGLSLQDMVLEQPSLEQLRALLKNESTLHLYKTYGAFEERGRRWLRELLWGWGVVNKRYLHAAIPFRRIPATGGMLIALMGCDGSGKSTQMKALIKWLSWKVDVVPIYFGSGDGPSSLLRKPLNLMARMIRDVPGFKSNREHLNSANREKTLAVDANDPLLRIVARVPWALVLAYEKCTKIRKVTKARNRGMIVISDRYPQNQVMGFNDGPLLSRWLNHRSWLLRTLADWESTPYRWAELNTPDIVIKLNVTPEVALNRKADAGIEEYRRRVAAIKSFNYPATTKVVLINANEPLEEVLIKAKRSIWEEL